MFVHWVVIFLLVCVVCEGAPSSKCGHDEFPCFDGSCVEKYKWCDSIADCDDDSDENYCYMKSGLIDNPNGCNENFYFLCRDGRCIPLEGRCDGYQSCYDNSDEEDCGTKTNDTEVFVHLSKTPVRNQTVIAELPMKTDIYSEEALEESHTRENILRGDSSVFQSTNYSETERRGNIPDDLVQAYSVDGNVDLDMMKYVDLHNDIAQVPVSQNTVSGSSTFKSVDLNLQENSPVYFSSTEMALKFELHDDILQDSVSGKKPVLTTLGDVDYRDTLQVNSISYSTSHEDLVVKHTNLHDDLETMSTSSVNVNDHNDMALKSMEVHNVIQADWDISLNISSTEDLERGFIELNARHFRRERDSAQQWLLKHRDEDYGWGEETARAMIALYMSDDDLIKLSEKLLMSKELHLKVFTALIRNQTKPISLGELSLYINALAASCDNPKNFYGHDLVNTLRHRTNAAQGSSEFVTPLVYLTLCLNNATTYADIRKTQEMVYVTRKIGRIDFEALVSLAATCISRIPGFSSYGIGQSIARKLYYKVIAEGLPENIYELALVSQALNEARINQDLWNRSKAMHLISVSQELDRSFTDILATYYAVPLLSGRSFVSLSQHCHRTKDKGLIPLEVLKNGKAEQMHVHYSLYFGNPVEMSQSLMLKVQKSSNFLDIMRIAETINPVYRFRYDMSRGKPTVYSIGGVVNDAEQGLYWTLHVSSGQNSTENLIPYEGDIRSFIPIPGDYIIFWIKSIF